MGNWRELHSYWNYFLQNTIFSAIKIFANSWPRIPKIFSRLLEQFFLKVGQNNFGNKIPYVNFFSPHFFSRSCHLQQHETVYPLFDQFQHWRGCLNFLDCRSWSARGFDSCTTFVGQLGHRWLARHRPRVQPPWLGHHDQTTKVIYLEYLHTHLFIYLIQVNLFQKLSFLNQLTHNITRDCSLNSLKNTSSQHVVYKYCFECQNKNEKTIFLHNLLWTCIFQGIQWTISCHIVG